MNKITFYLGAGLLLLVLGYAGGRYLQPPTIQSKTVEKEVIKNNIVTVVKEVKNPDGTVTTETQITDHTQISQEDISQFKATVKPEWKAQFIAGVKDFKLDQPIYGVGVERRILGPISAGLYGKSNNEYGLTVSLEF